MSFLTAPFVAIRSWPIESQQRSRRNAMIASTALAQRRAQNRAVDEYLTARAHPAPAAVPRTYLPVPRAVQG